MPNLIEIEGTFCGLTDSRRRG